MTEPNQRKRRKRKPQIQHQHSTGKFALDRRAGALSAMPEGQGEELINTTEVAEWLKVSTQWVEIGRTKGYGPPFVLVSPGMIRYRPSAVRGWLTEREFKCTAEYKQRQSA